MFFASADDEFLIFIDKKNNLEIIARELSLETNLDGKEIRTLEELMEFAQSAHFPSHGLILRRSLDDSRDMTKGITDMHELRETYEQLISKYTSVYVETDMRAMYNPSRMKVIEAATYTLIEKINSLCPECHMPGFGITDAKK